MGFQPVRDAAIFARLPEESRGKVLCLDLKPRGLKSFKPLELGGFSSGRGFGTHPISELFFNGLAMPMARWPNQGYVSIAGLPGGGESSKTGPFLYEGSRPERWLKETDAWLYGYWFYGWADSYERIASIDPAKHAIALAPPYHNYGYHKGQPFCAVNVLAELDMPGEWYLDRSNAVLYFWPPSDPEKAVIELSLAECPFIVMQEVSHLTLQGLTWELGCGDAVRIHGGDHCLVAGCTVRRFGGNGIEIAGGTDHGILSCDIYSLGRGGTIVSGGNRKTLSPGRHFVENCHIYDLSRIDRTYTPAILMGGVGNRIAHNRLHDIPSSAIRLEGNNHLVEYNEVFRVVRESDDQGGVDMFGNPTYRGNLFRFNYWHHIGNWQRPNEGPACGQAGIRLDDAISGVLIYGNLFYRASAGKLGFGGVQIHGGKDNILDNNVFVDCESAISLSPWSSQRWQDYTRNTLAIARDRPQSISHKVSRARRAFRKPQPERHRPQSCRSVPNVSAPRQRPAAIIRQLGDRRRPRLPQYVAGRFPAQDLVARRSTNRPSADPDRRDRPVCRRPSQRHTCRHRLRCGRTLTWPQLTVSNECYVSSEGAANGGRG